SSSPARAASNSAPPARTRARIREASRLAARVLRYSTVRARAVSTESAMALLRSVRARRRAEVGTKRLFGEPDSASERHEIGVEGELEREPVDERQDQRRSLAGGHAPEGPGCDAARDARREEPPGARVGVPVQPRERPVVERLAPEL